jgi:hypothetical protein
MMTKSLLMLKLETCRKKSGLGGAPYIVGRGWVGFLGGPSYVRDQSTCLLKDTMRVFYKEEEKKKVEKKESSGGAEREKKRRDFSYNHFYERLEDRLWSDLVKM